MARKLSAAIPSSAATAPTSLSERWQATRFGSWLETQRLGYADLFRHNPAPRAAGILFSNLLGIRRVVQARIGGVAVTLRTGAPDFSVAVETLGREYDPLIAGFTHATDGIIIDAGGYIGTAAIKLARAYPGCRIVCVEPSSENLALLRLNIAPYPNIRVLHAALAASPGEVTLRDPGRKQWGFTILGGEGGGRILETIPAVTVGQILEEEGRDRVVLLKLDIEGAEVDLLRHPDGWLPRTEVLIAELHEWIVEGVEAAFAAATTGRLNIPTGGEKVISVHPDAVRKGSFAALVA